ncbi:phage head-tail connector protein [Lactococcus petauri]|uniref:phage head-tail connector protein n=1 Tax=Lactococcus petauri TaxID=1940789 RepID=UPI0022E2D7C3|nr:phage head-tail connector protein [Lactococcus petauri]
MDDILEEVKRSLEIESDEKLDSQLKDFINRISKQLCVRLGFLSKVPENLNYIVVECAIKRFNRKGNEGMASYAQEGETISYGALLDEFEEDIIAYKENEKSKTVPRRGVMTVI